MAVVEQFRRQRRASMAAVEDAIARKQKEVAQQQAAEQAKTAEAAGAAAAAEASAAKDEAVSTAALLAQAKHPRSTPPPTPSCTTHPHLTCGCGGKVGHTYRTLPVGGMGG